MVNFIIGMSGSGKSTEICRMIREEMESGGRDVVLIVPEQQAVAWETRMSGILPSSANLRLEITNFTRLSNSVFREYGGLSDRVADEGSRSLIVWRAMLAVRDEMRMYIPKDGGHEDRAVPFLMKAIDELKQSGISPEAAEAALDELEAMESGDGGETHASLIKRLSDAVNVYAAYNTILHEEFVDRGDVLDNLFAVLRTHPYFAGKRVFIDSFFSLTAPEERLLSLIIAQAHDVTVTFACPAEESRRDSLVFGEIADFMRKTASIAARCGKDVNKILLEGDKRHAQSCELELIGRELFADRETADADVSAPSESVKIIKCADVYDEAEACASIILGLIREGYKYSDIAVVARDISSREGIVDAVLRRHGIKCFMSQSSEVSSSPAVKLVLAALSVASGGWQRRDIISLVKTGMTPPPQADSPFGGLETNIFESYTYTWSIRGRRMYCSDKWTMNPDGYSDELSETGEEALRAANACKDRIIPPLERMLSVFDEGHGVAEVRQIAERIVYFAEEYGVGDRLREMSESYRSIGMDREAEHTLASWDAVCEILDKMVALLGDTILDSTRFTRLFGLLAANMDRGTIPTGVDEVALGSATGIRFDSVKCMIMLGAVEDEFPRSPDTSADYFDDQDKLALESVGLTIASPDGALALSREYFMFYRTATAATDRLYVLAPTGDDGELSSGAAEIEKILAGSGRSATRIFGSMPLDEIVYDKHTAEYLLSRRTSRAELAELRRIAGEGKGGRVELTARADSIAPTAVRSRSLSPTAITDFVDCRFRYYCKSRARLKAEKKAEFRLNNIGTFIHRIFELFFTELSAERIADGDVSREEMESIAAQLIEEEIGRLSEMSSGRRGEPDGRIKYLFERVSRYVLVFIEAMERELKQSRFLPTALELGIGKGDDGNSIDSISFETEDGCRISLRGIADRVDIYDAPDGKRYVRVVDYKTGGKEFSLDKVSKGLEIQLLLYLFSVWKFGLPGDGRELIPAGAVYFNVKPATAAASSITAADANRESAIMRAERSGVLLSDDGVLRAMEGEVGSLFKLKEANGVIVPDGKSAKTVLLSAEEFGELYDTLGDTLKRIAAEMNSGQAEAQAGDACRFCDYGLICRTGRGGR